MEPENRWNLFDLNGKFSLVLSPILIAFHFLWGLVETLLKFQDFFDSCEEVGKEVELCLAQAGQVG